MIEVCDLFGNLLGFCDLKTEQIKGRSIQRAVAIESGYCEACKIKHTFFTIVHYNIGWSNGDSYIIADSHDEAVHLPGFRQYWRDSYFVIKGGEHDPN